MDEIENKLDINKIWEDTLSSMQTKVSAVTYDVWIKTLEPIAIRGNAIVFSCPTNGAKGVVLKSYAEKLRESLKEVNNEIIDFEIEVDGEEPILDRMNKIDEKKNGEKEENSFVNQSMFNPKYTFDNFVVGPTNEFTVAAAKAVAENPGTNYNPLFIYGGVGLGKTHIMHAIGNYLCENKPALKVVYVTTEQFTNEFIETVGKNELNLNTGFRNKYRNCDVLLVDDIQSIIGKPRVQEEFFHTFNALTSLNKQIILSSDRPPKEINPLEERLRSRFEWGLMTDIGIPEKETRIAILKKKSEIERYLIDDDVLEYIAEAMTTNIRELEGFLFRCVFYSGLVKCPRVTLDIAKEALKNYITISKASYDAEKIIEQVCKYYNISKNQLMSKSRKAELATARQVSMYLLDNMLEMPYTAIGKLFGKDHSTVIYCKNKVIADMKKDKNLETQIKDIKSLC